MLHSLASRSFVCLLQRYSMHVSKAPLSHPTGGKRGGQDMKQNFISQQACSEKQEMRLGKVFGSGFSWALGLTVWTGVLCSLLPPFLSSYSLSLFATVSLSLPNWFARIFCCFCTAYPSQNQAYLPISLLEQSVYSLCQGENESMEWEACDDSKSSALKHWSKYKVVFAWALHRCYQGQNTVHL